MSCFSYLSKKFTKRALAFINAKQFVMQHTVQYIMVQCLSVQYIFDHCFKYVIKGILCNLP